MEGFEGQEFLRQADQEYLVARILLNGGVVLSSKGTYHAHTALEMILKSYIVELLQVMKGGHDLELLALKCRESNDAYFSDPVIIEKFKAFNPFQQLGRYGANSNRSADLLSLDTPELKSRGVIVIDSTMRSNLDELYLNVRARIPTKQINGLKAILEDQVNHMFIKGWQLPMTPSAVLKLNNPYLDLIN